MPAPIEITATVAESANIWLVDVRLVAYDPIADPIAYVQLADVSAEILARAGLDADLSFVDARLVGSGSSGSELFYDLQITYGVPPVNTLTHSHSSTTVNVPLRDAYRDGPHIDLVSTLGPVIISYTDDGSVDYLRIRTDLDTTPRDIFFVRQGSIIQSGAHYVFNLDDTYDIGTADGGVILERPRDIYLSRNLDGGGDLTFVGSGAFGTFTESAYHIFDAQAANPDTDPTHRHLTVNSIDNSLRYWDGTTWIIISPGGGGSDTQGTYDCSAAVQVEDMVYVTSSNLVDRATAAVLNNRPPVGVCVSKPSATTCIVRYTGEIPMTGPLVPGARYFVGKTAGVITNNDASFVENETACSVGIAKTATTLVLLIGEPKKL